MRKVILESPFAGNWWQRRRNIKYARACMRDALLRDEAPMVSHLLYTQVLDDSKADERKTGIDAGLAWLATADAMVVYNDRGVSNGMSAAITIARTLGVKIEYRSIK